MSRCLIKGTGRIKTVLEEQAFHIYAQSIGAVALKDDLAEKAGFFAYLRCDEEIQLSECEAGIAGLVVVVESGEAVDLEVRRDECSSGCWRALHSSFRRVCLGRGCLDRMSLQRSDARLELLDALE